MAQPGPCSRSYLFLFIFKISSQPGLPSRSYLLQNYTRKLTSLLSNTTELSLGKNGHFYPFSDLMRIYFFSPPATSDSFQQSSHFFSRKVLKPIFYSSHRHSLVFIRASTHSRTHLQSVPSLRSFELLESTSHKDQRQRRQRQRRQRRRRQRQRLPRRHNRVPVNIIHPSSFYHQTFLHFLGPVSNNFICISMKLPTFV